MGYRSREVHSIHEPETGPDEIANVVRIDEVIDSLTLEIDTLLNTDSARLSE